MKNSPIFLLLFLLVSIEKIQSQCPFSPTVGGDTILCPDTGGILKTQQYDSYQWYRRAYPNGQPEVIQGATGQTLAVANDDLLFYFWVEATLDSCTEASPEVLLDGYVFLLPFVQHGGQYTFDPVEQVFKVCEGDTMFLTLGLPYTTNISWFWNGMPLAGETGQTLAIVKTGDYTVEGAPEVCPDFIQPLGLTLPVVVESCLSAAPDLSFDAHFQLYPNPAKEWLRLENKSRLPVHRLEVLDMTGRVVISISDIGAGNTDLLLSHLPTGSYLLKISTGEKLLTRKFVKN